MPQHTPLTTRNLAKTTHVLLYKAFSKIKGVTHTHSVHAVMFAQACKELPCMGTTHADHFMGTVPLARALTPEEMDDYEVNTGNVIVERFKDIAYMEMPAVLVSHHGPFTWGKTPMDSVKNGIALDTCAEMALGALQLNPDAPELPAHILAKHYQRKHGSDAYYGQG